MGPANLTTWITSIPPYWEVMRSLLNKRVGDPETEQEFLRGRSPLFKVDQIKIPMLIAQGANDPRVPKAESEQIVEALKEKGIDYEYLLFEEFVRSGANLFWFFPLLLPYLQWRSNLFYSWVD